MTGTSSNIPQRQPKQTYMLATNSTSQKAAVNMILKPRKSEGTTMSDTKSMAGYSNTNTSGPYV
jgi:hypothetical protein